MRKKERERERESKTEREKNCPGKEKVRLKRKEDNRWEESLLRTSRIGLKSREEADEGKGKSPRTVQIFVKIDGSKALQLEVSLSDKVDDIVKRILNSMGWNRCDVYVTCERKVLRRNEELRSCGVSDGCTVQVVTWMRGGDGKHRNKKNEAEKKPTAKGQEPVLGQQEHDEENHPEVRTGASTARTEERQESVES